MGQGRGDGGLLSDIDRGLKDIGGAPLGAECRQLECRVGPLQRRHRYANVLRFFALNSESGKIQYLCSNTGSLHLFKNVFKSVFCVYILSVFVSCGALTLYGYD